MFTVLPAILQMGQIKFNWNLSEYRLHGSQFMTVVMVDIYYIMLYFMTNCYCIITIAVYETAEHTHICDAHATCIHMCTILSQCI